MIAVAVFDPAVAAGIARMSLAGIAVFGLALVIYLSTHGFDRAVLLIPTWLLLVVWTIAAGLAVTGIVTNDIIGPALLGGLVLIVMLIGFTVMQHAFAGGITHGIVSDVERRALALTGAGDMIWDWDVSADKVFTSPETEHMLGLKRGALEGPAATLARRAASARSRSLPRLARRRRSSSGAAGSPRISGCAPPTAIISGSRSRRGRWSAPTAKSCAWSAR